MLTLCTSECLVGLCGVQIPGPSSTEGLTPVLQERSGNPDQGFVFFFSQTKHLQGLGMDSPWTPFQETSP